MSSEHPPGDIQRLADELAQLRERLGAIDERLAAVESALPTAPAPSLPAGTTSQPELFIPDESVEIVDAQIVPEQQQPREPANQQHRPAAMIRTAAERPLPTSERPAPNDGPMARLQSVVSEQWEDIVGGRWMTWAGALTLIVAVAFFVPWAWTQLDLPDTFKVLMLHGLGVAVSAGAFVLHRRGMTIFAQGLAGIGIFTLYASAWAAQNHYEIWGPRGDVLTFVECAIITALTIAAAVASRSVAMVLLGALGGYITPMIAGSSDPNHIALFSYLAFLNVALVGSAVFRSWSFLKPIALLATMIMFGMWLTMGFDATDHLWSTQWLATLHWFIFLLGGTLPPLVWKRQSNWLDLVALSTNSIWFVGVTWGLFHNRPDQQLAFVCWGLTLLHLVLFGATYNRVTNVDRMPRVHLALAAIFFILAMPLQLEDSLTYLGLAWAAQGVVLSAVGIYFRDRQMCVSSLIVFALAAMRLLTFDYFSDPELVGGIDPRLLMFTFASLLMILGGALYPLAGRLLRHDEQGAHFWEPAGGALMAAGNVLAMIGLTCQWDSRLVLLIWTIDAAAIWAAGFIMPRYGHNGRAVRVYGMILSIFLAGGRALYHADEVAHALAGEFTLMFNDRFGTLFLLSSVYFVGAWAYRKYLPGKDADGKRSGVDLAVEKILDPAFAILASLILLLTFSFEVHSWFENERSLGRQPFGDMRMAEQASYSILWSVYAAAAVVLGLALRWPVLRYIGMVGLALTLVKVFFIDLSSLVLLARVLALAVLGMMLLAVSFIYQRFAARLKEAQ